MLEKTGRTDTPEARELQSKLEETLCGHAGALERVHESLRQSEAQLRHAQKMEAVGRLAGGVAHDFNNVLSVILGAADLLLSDMKEGDPLREDVEVIREAGARGAGLTRQLLMFSRRQMAEPKVVDTRALLADVEKMLRRMLGEDIALVCQVDTPAPCVEADPGLLEQVLMNLAVNARDAMPHGGQLEIEISSVVLAAPLRSEGAVGPHAMLSVTDTGCGMDAATQARIFEPFFTTKEPGRGTGLGLSTVFGIVQQGGGSITVSSAPGKGTRFVVYWPSVKAEPERSAQDAVSRSARGSETVLVVEDEDSVRAIAGGVLRRYGYKVIEARNAGEALLACESHPGPIDLLLADVVMPRLGGPELAVRLLRLRPELRVLFMSGYANDATGVAEPGSARAAYLQKPLTVHGLTQKVREVLDAAPMSRASSAAE